MTYSITKEQLEELWKAIDYTRGTITYSPQQSMLKPDLVLIHKGRAHLSMLFLDDALKLLDEIKEELE
jgi:hypothetical protein